LLGVAAAFFINGVSFIAVIAALLAMRIPPAPKPAGKKHVLHNLKEGMVYAFGFAPIRAILALLALVSLLGMPYTVMMPAFAQLLGGGPRTLGLLMSSTGLGALAGALLLASRPSARGLGKVMAMASASFGAALMAFCLSRSLWLSIPLLAAAGCGGMIHMACGNTLLQTIVDDDKRGRVMSFYTMAFMGMAPFGSLLAGGLASRLGAPGALTIGGMGCILAAALFALRLPGLGRLVHPIYVLRGLAPELAPEELPVPAGAVSARQCEGPIL
jgi:MFS family permease